MKKLTNLEIRLFLLLEETVSEIQDGIFADITPSTLHSLAGDTIVPVIAYIANKHHKQIEKAREE